MQKEDPVMKKRRTSRVGYSRRRTSPKKADQNDMSREPSPTISESALQEETIPEETAQEEAAMQEETTTQEETAMQEETVVQEETSVPEKKPLSPEKHEEETKDPLQSIENESTNSMDVMKEEDEIKDTDITESNKDEKDITVLQVSPTKSPMGHSDTDVSISKESLDDKDDVDEKQDSIVEMKSNQETVENTDVKESENTTPVFSVADAQEDITIINDTCDKSDNSKKEAIQHEEEHVESVDNDDIVESINDNETADIPDTEHPIIDLLDEEQDIDINESDELKPEDQFMEDKNVLSTSEKEVDSSIEKSQDDEVCFIN